MENKNNSDGSALPLGLGMAFAQNAQAMTYFSSLSQTERQAVIDRAHRVKSKEEMQALVDALGKRG